MSTDYSHTTPSPYASRMWRYAGPHLKYRRPLRRPRRGPGRGRRRHEPLNKTSGPRRSPKLWRVSGRLARPSIGRHGGSCERSKLVGPGLSRGARQACRRQRPRGMEPGHLLCRRRARSRPQGARTRRRQQTGNQRWLRRSRSQHSTQNTRRENWKHRATEGPRPPQRPSTSRKRRTSRPALTEHVGDESSLALYRSEGPDKAGRTAAKCVWTGSAQPISSAASARRTGNEMDCTGSAGDDHRSKGPTPRRLDAHVEGCAAATALTDSAWWWTRLGRLRRRIRGAGALLRKAESAACAAVSGKTAPCRKKHAGTVACAGFAAPRSRLPRRRLALDNCCYRASNR